MSKQYWIAAGGYVLSHVLALLVMLTTIHASVEAALGSGIIFLFGWQARRFLSAMEREDRSA